MRGTEEDNHQQDMVLDFEPRIDRETEAVEQKEDYV